MARVVEGGKLAQLRAAGPHEEERIADTELERGAADLAAQEPCHEFEGLGGAQLPRESGVGGPATPITRPPGLSTVSDFIRFSPPRESTTRS